MVTMSPPAITDMVLLPFHVSFFLIFQSMFVMYIAYLDTLYCVDIDNYSPDIVLVDFSVNDYHHPKYMDSLLRKLLQMGSRPIVALINLWVAAECPTPRYLVHSFYYVIPLFNICPAAKLCYGKRLPKFISEEYSTTDGVHPWGTNGVPFIGNILYAWWSRYQDIIVQDQSLDSSLLISPKRHSQSSLANPAPSKRSGDHLKPALFNDNPIGLCTRCDALVDDANAKLTPVGDPIGFYVAVRTKIGFGGFQPNSSVKSFRKSWQAETPGSTISFRFYGSTVAIAMWQRRDGMGILHATIDGDNRKIATASGFFKGFTWAMERNNTGRSEIVTLFEGLEDKAHVLTLTVSNEPANIWVKGHLVQIFALLSASSHSNCRSVSLN